MKGRIEGQKDRTIEGVNLVLLPRNSENIFGVYIEQKNKKNIKKAIFNFTDSLPSLARMSC